MNAEPQLIIRDDIMMDAARRFVRTCSDCVRDRGIFQVVLSGGSTPQALYSALAEPPFIDAVDWESVEIFFGDELNLPPQHPDSNYNMVRRRLLDRVPLVTGQIHRMAGENRDLAQSAEAYENIIRKRLIPDEYNRKAFDLVLLGLGADGRTASLFPNSLALQETERWVVATQGTSEEDMRLTITYVAINSARQIWFLATGPDKANIVAEVLKGGGNAYPASKIDPEDGDFFWLLDEAAASKIDPEIRARLSAE